MSKRFLIARHAISLVVECWALAEIAYYCTHDEETLHSVVLDMLHNYSERLRYRRTVRETFDMIHDLPETESDRA